ncbi:MAG TPA: FtsX-like permease family protein [Dinghuibacter sp.]|uniref:ABC transporter permease n=1 Tax=Dinghuibacter sp. TaxID=2024697 RepID=UPI002C33A6A0|nr:FtsX-like permease family protein [Dinghuibacter sp.]HTJ13746.1 FtsX-like permease family protein [Dinghuibacter sp.]
MSIAEFIAKRIAFNRERTFSRFIIRLAIIAVTLSVATMIVALSFTNGFQSVISQKVFSFWGHIRVEHYEPEQTIIAEETPIAKNDTVLEAVHSDPRVGYIDAFATKSAMLKTNEGIEGILFKGVEKDFHFDRLSAFLRQGHWVSFPDSGYSHEIDLSEYTASQLKLHVGDGVLIYFIQPNAPPRARKLQVAGIYKTGIEEYDHNFCLGDLRLIRRLNDWDSTKIGGYEVFVKDYREMASVNDSVRQLLPPEWNCQTIQDVYPNIFDWLNLQNTTKGLTLIIMTIVAVLNLVTCLIILVLERTRMVGILKAIGSTDNTIQGIFLIHAGLITFWGIFLGTALGLGLCWLQQSTGLIKLDEDAYYMPVAPIKIVWWQIAATDIFTLVICFAVMLIPVQLVKRISPVRAIRFN